MNRTELKAMQWLLAQGEEPIFQPRKSPDFICPDGKGFEVKLLRENTITFSASQFEILSSFENQLKILVFDDGDEPLHIIPFEEIAEKPRYWKHIHIAIYDYESPKTLRDLDSELYNQARADALKRGITIGDWMNEAMAEKLIIANGGKKQPTAKP